MSLCDPIRAKRFAEIRHAGQTYADEAPYSVHLENVGRVLMRFGVSDPVSLCAAWLHDVIEDTNTSYNDIKIRFGLDVAERVYAVTSELGRNRKERNAKTYPKIRVAGRDAIMLKLADRIANVEYGMATGGKADMYAEEYPSFKAELYNNDDSKGWLEGNAYPELEPVWAYLDKLLAAKP